MPVFGSTKPCSQTNLAAIQAFVSASDYCDEVCEGINFDVEVVPEWFKWQIDI